MSILTNHIDAIRYELQLVRDELRSRLFDYSLFESSCNEEVKNSTLMYHIKEELQDVERALFKIKNGTYGVCEETKEVIPFEKLRIIPTARTVYDFFFQELYEKKSLPQVYNTEAKYAQNHYFG